MRKSPVPVRVAVAVAGAVALAAVAAATTAAISASATTPAMTITSLNVHHLPALTAKATVTITGTGFSEDAINSVAINGCTAGSYLVTSASTIIFKTDNTCTTSSTGVITITPATGANVVTSPTTNAKQALAFVALPSIAANDTTHYPVQTAGTAGLTTPTKTASLSGGTAVRVTAGTVSFVNSSAYPLSASLDGNKLTSITMHTTGDYFTGVLPAMAADTAPTLAITSNGVTKSFAYAAANASAVTDSFDFQIVASPAITITPAFGPVNGSNVIAIKGSGFTASTTVTVNSVNCPVVVASVKATSLSCTVPAGTSAGPVTVQTSTSSTTSVVSAGSTYTYVP